MGKREYAHIKEMEGVLDLSMIRQAMKKEKKKAAAELWLHSDQGFQYAVAPMTLRHCA